MAVERELLEEDLAIGVVDDLADERTQDVERRLRRAVEAQAPRARDVREVARRAGLELGERRERRRRP